MMTEKKPFNFDKWFNIALVVIVGLHFLSFLNNILSVSTVQTMLETMATPAQTGYAVPRPNVSAALEAAMPQLVVMVFIGHVISTIIFIGLAYIALKYVERNPD